MTPPYGSPLLVPRHARAFGRSLLVAVALAWAALSPSTASAAPKDAQALKLDDDAINNDYLATKFGDAEKKLRQAIALCAKGACSPNVAAQVRRDLGIILVVASRPDEAKAQFVEALQIDPSTAIPKELKTPEVEQTFAAAKGGPAPAAPAPAKPAPAPAPAAPPASSGGGEDIAHTPPAESAILTPVPLYAELPESMNPRKVQVKYKPFGAPDWKTVDMKKMKTGYGVELPCIEIGSTAGDLKYYIQAVGANGDVIATNGTKNAPLKVAVKAQIAGEAPHLPGKPAPKQCQGGGGTDCPPEFPGCKAAKKGAGFSCESDLECSSDQCKDGKCFSEETPEAKCDSDQGCEAGQYCNGGICTGPRKNWIGGMLQQDAVLANSATDVCLNQSDYTCFDDQGNYYGGEHARPGASDEVAGGFTPATTRILIAYDRVISDNVMLGARLGYAFGGGPQVPETATSSAGKPFFPAHIEARASYWFGSDPFISVGIRPYVVGALGAAEFDGKVSVKVFDGTTNANAMSFTASAWKKAGSFFVAGGFGLMYALDHNSGIVLELKGMATVPTVGVGASLQAGYSVGLF